MSVSNRMPIIIPLMKMRSRSWTSPFACRIRSPYSQCSRIHMSPQLHTQVCWQIRVLPWIAEILYIIYVLSQSHTAHVSHSVELCEQFNSPDSVCPSHSSVSLLLAVATCFYVSLQRLGDHFVCCALTRLNVASCDSISACRIATFSFIRMQRT